jgi:hypothetical protein
MKTHLSQSIGAGASAGQHGIDMPSMAIAVDASPATPAIDASAAGPAMAGRDSGASTNAAITAIANSRRMVIWRCTAQIPTGASKLKVVQTNDRVITYG